MQTTFQKQEQGTLLSLPPLVFQVSGLQQGPQLGYPLRTQSWLRVGVASRGVGAYKAGHLGCKPHEYNDTIFVSMLLQREADLSVFSLVFGRCAPVYRRCARFVLRLRLRLCLCLCLCLCLICCCAAAAVAAVAAAAAASVSVRVCVCLCLCLCLCPCLCLISYHLISIQLMPSHPTSSHLVPSHRIQSHPIPSHSIPSHPISSHLISSPLLSSHYFSSFSPLSPLGISPRTPEQLVRPRLSALGSVCGEYCHAYIYI